MITALFQVNETIPVADAGPLVLRYPKWLPGNHSTTGPVELLAGLTITAGKGAPRVEWRRDPVEMHAYQVDVPAGTSALEMSFQYITPNVEQRLTAGAHPMRRPAVRAAAGSSVCLNSYRRDLSSQTK